MSDQLPLPFVSIAGATLAAPPEAFPEVRRLRRNPARSRPMRLAGRDAEAPPGARPEDDSLRLDIHDYLVRHDDSSFLFEARDDAMSGVGIFAGDLLVVDKRIQPAHGHIVVALIEGERYLRRLHHRGRKTALLAEHEDFPEIALEDGSELIIWGVVSGAFRRFGV